MQVKIAAFADEASRDFKGQIAAMERNEIKLLEIRFIDEENIADISREKALEIRRQLDDHGLSVWAIGSPTGKVSLKNDFTPHFDAFRHQLDLAEILGAKHYRLFSFYDTDSTDACFDLICTKMQCMLDAAKGSGILLCHENEKGIYGDQAEKCRRLLAALPELRAVFDPANFLQVGQQVLPAWEMLAPYVEYLHIKDCNAEGKVVPPGAGLANLKELLRRYFSKGGQVVTLEPHLTAFIGLDRLENGERTQSAYSYISGEEAFDAAADALKTIIREAELQ